MLYNYISKKELNKLYEDNRQVFIIKNVNTADIDEYINTILALASSSGIDINVLNQPRLISVHKNVEYDIAIIIKEAFRNKLNNFELKQIMVWLGNIGNCVTLKQYINDINKDKVIKQTSITINDVHNMVKGNYKVIIEFKQIGTNKKFRALLRFRCDNNINSIESTSMKFEEPVDYKDLTGKLINYTTDVKNLHDNIKDIVAYSCREAYQLCRLNPIKMILVNRNSQKKEFNIEITLKSIEFNLV